MNDYHPDDDQLADQLQSGVLGADSVFCDRFRPILLKYALSKRYSYDDAEDLAQDTLLTAWLRIKSFIRGSDMARWLVGIEHKLILKRQEKDNRVRAAMQTLAFLPRSEDLDTKEKAALLARVELHLAVMSNKTYARAVRLRYFDMMTLDEVAGALGLSSADVAREYVRRGLAKLKEMDAASAPEEPPASDH